MPHCFGKLNSHLFKRPVCHANCRCTVIDYYHSITTAYDSALNTKIQELIWLITEIIK